MARRRGGGDDYVEEQQRLMRELYPDQIINGRTYSLIPGSNLPAQLQVNARDEGPAYEDNPYFGWTPEQYRQQYADKWSVPIDARSGPGGSVYAPYEDILRAAEVEHSRDDPWSTLFPLAVLTAGLGGVGSSLYGAAGAGAGAGAETAITGGISNAPNIGGQFLPVSSEVAGGVAGGAGTGVAEGVLGTGAGFGGATGGWSAGTNALLGMSPAEIGAINAAFPYTAGIEGAGLAAGAGGAVAPTFAELSARLTGSQIGQSAFDKLLGALKKIPTSLIPLNSDGSVDYEKALEKYGPSIGMAAATSLGTALGGGSSLKGGDLNAGPELAKQEEDRKAALRAQVNALFDQDYSAEENRATGAIRGRYTDELKDLYDTSARNLKFSLARAGQTGGSLQADKLADLEKQNRLGSGRIEEAVQSSLSGLRADRESNRARALGLVDVGSGEEAVRSGQAAIKSGLDLASSQQRQNLFSDMFNDAAYMSALRNNQDATAAGRAFYNSRRGLTPSGAALPSGGARTF